MQLSHLLVTGGAGFIGSNFVHRVLREYPQYQVTVLDKLTYAGNLDNLAGVAADPRYRFVQGDICDPLAVADAMAGCDAVVNFAAESHVDRSVIAPDAFIKANFDGVYFLLEEARRVGVQRFLQVSTDEVYGHVECGRSREGDPLAPRSPYSAAKAGGEMLAYSYFVSFGLPVVITRGSNTVGPYQYPEKVMPLFITNALADQPLPIYGSGQAVRDYLYVEDHCTAIDLVLHEGEPGEAYNVGAGNEVNGVELAEGILDRLGKPCDLMRFVTDRPGHDYRYCMDFSKTRALGWRPAKDFAAMLDATIDWYVHNRAWWEKIKSGEYKEYYRRMYAQRLDESVK